MINCLLRYVGNQHTTTMTAKMITRYLPQDDTDEVNNPPFDAMKPFTDFGSPTSVCTSWPSLQILIFLRSYNHDLILKLDDVNDMNDQLTVISVQFPHWLYIA
ncbi:hypothetical protein PoB_002056200 [Plakobranchus ocellatus]|uniref:Uncharacterized protein n=1 Tax=Plakobranchus ocellatus TaxID=259542 RepID=A0AAV3ZHP6_9GAST|nr:hypothetical protein PoB_002056200 [Plakobranchus ocellatus]